MKKKLINYGIIILYSILLINILLGENQIYGSEVDWINQHTVIPEFFRNQFYETKKFIPNYIFNLGAGQNIFNYSYYGLMSPIILISYCLPNISMETFIIIASISLYLLSGIFLFHFLQSKNIPEKMSLLATLSFQTLSPLTFHFHHHIMFVWYFPFLILSLFGVDSYINKKKSLLLMSSIFLLIMTNYYYAVPSILVIVIYIIYMLLSRKNWHRKIFLIDCLKASIRIVIPILLSSFILFPTAYSMLNTGRNNNSLNTIANLLLPNIEQVLYSSFSIGLTYLLLIAPFGILCQNKIKKSDAFLSISLIICTFCPIIMYFLNGLLYARGKVLIPLLVLYILVLTKFVQSLYNNKINLKKLTHILLIITIIFIAINYYNTYIIWFMIDVIITCVALRIFINKKKLSIIYIPLLFILLICSISNNNTEIYVQEDPENTDEIVKKLFDNIKDNSFYRSDTLINTNKHANKSYKSNHNNTTIYSSTNNRYYWNFYNFEIGNNIEHRNMLNISGANNPIFNHLMGVKYIITKRNEEVNYQKITSLNNIGLYENKNVNPILYITDDYGSNKEYQKLSFPYNIEYLINYPITNTSINKKHKSNIKKLDFQLKKRYKFTLKKDKVITYPLEEGIKDKFLIITFDMNYNSICKKNKTIIKKDEKEEKKSKLVKKTKEISTGDTAISINGIKNKLTCADWPYHNKNEKFQYIISSNEELTNLKIKLSEGKYNISNINIYTLDNKLPRQQELNQVKVNKKESTITASTLANKTSYVITSLPFDKGFKVFVDNKEVKAELVNTAFLGFKVQKGFHQIKIKYTSPWYNLGKVISKIGVILLIVILSTEKINHKMRNKNQIISKS